MGKRKKVSQVFALDRAKASMKLLEVIQERGRSKVVRAKIHAWRGLKGLGKIEQIPLVLKLRKLGFSTRDELNDLRSQINRLEARLAKLEPQQEPAPQAFPQA